MHPPGADTVLVRHGDLNTKSNTVKRYMEDLLAENIEALLADRSVPGEVERRWNRPLIHTSEDAVEAATDAATDAFGVVSASPALTVSTEQARILEAVAETAREHYDGGTFAVDARRADKSLPYDSEDLARDAGNAIWEPSTTSSNPRSTSTTPISRSASRYARTSRSSTSSRSTGRAGSRLVPKSRSSRWSVAGSTRRSRPTK